MKISGFCIKAFLTGAWLCAVLLACGGVPAPASSRSAGPKGDPDAAGMDLDAAIREAAVQMGENLPGGTKVALVSVASSSAQLSEYVISRLEAALVSGKKLVVVDRSNLDKVREEQGFQLSGEVDDDSAKSIGKLLGAGAIVTGAFADLGDVYSLTLKAINIETATVAVSYPADVAKSMRIGTLLANGGDAGTGTRTAQTGGSAPSAAQTAAFAPAAAPPAPAYKIGDTGPAGGLIFYDKGNNSGGWRYLEAAPTETEEKLNWLTNEVHVDGTKTELGTGKRNTQSIIADLSIGVPEAALHCVELECGGFRDWFLPSKDELNLMYINLKRKNLGDFANELYWSSSEAGYIMQYAWAGPGDGWRVWVQNFKDANQSYGYMNRSGRSSVKVRACRQF
jgi:hypothetical protein